MWPSICSVVPDSKFGKADFCMDRNKPFLYGQMESPNTSLQVIKLNPSCLRQAHFNKPGTSHGYKGTEPECTFTVLHVPLIIHSLDCADALFGRIV